MHSNFIGLPQLCVLSSEPLLSILRCKICALPKHCVALNKSSVQICQFRAKKLDLRLTTSFEQALRITRYALRTTRYAIRITHFQTPQIPSNKP